MIKLSFALSKATTSIDHIQISQIYVYTMWNITTLRYLMSTLRSKAIHPIENSINLTSTEIKAKSEEFYQHKTFFVLFVFGITWVTGFIGPMEIKAYGKPSKCQWTINSCWDLRKFPCTFLPSLSPLHLKSLCNRIVFLTPPCNFTAAPNTSKASIMLK